MQVGDDLAHGSRQIDGVAAARLGRPQLGARPVVRAHRGTLRRRAAQRSRSTPPRPSSRRRRRPLSPIRTPPLGCLSRDTPDRAGDLRRCRPGRRIRHPPRRPPCRLPAWQGRTRPPMAPAPSTGRRHRERSRVSPQVGADPSSLPVSLGWGAIVTRVVRTGQMVERARIVRHPRPVVTGSRVRYRRLCVVRRGTLPQKVVSEAYRRLQVTV